MCTPKGVLYERECIYEYILKEKTRIAQELKKWELQQVQKPAEERSKRKMEEEARALGSADKLVPDALVGYVA